MRRIVNDIEFKLRKLNNKFDFFVKDDFYAFSDKSIFLEECKNILGLCKSVKIDGIKDYHDFKKFIFKSQQDAIRLQKEIEDHFESVIKNRIFDNLLERRDYVESLYNKILKNDTYLIHTEQVKNLAIIEAQTNWIEMLYKMRSFFSKNDLKSFGKELNNFNIIYNKIRKYNESFVKNRKKKYEYLFKKSPFEIDDTQKNAVIIDDKHNLIVAGAGSGKTEVIINRIAYLMERDPDQIKSNRILALAFQRDAANEMKARLKKRYNKNVEIRTFHSLGLDILKRCGERFSVYGRDNYENRRLKLIVELIEKERQVPRFNNSLIKYMKYVGIKDKTNEEVDFETKEEFYHHQKQLEFIALDGTKVKSFGELTILNFFLTHKINGKNIKVLYESNADWMKYVDEQGRSQTPSPDFYLPEYDIYFEHWSVDKNNGLPDYYDSEKYIKTMKLKEEKFHEKNKILIETTFGEFIDDSDFENIIKERLLNALNKTPKDTFFEISPIPYAELVEKVWDECKAHLKSLPHNISNYIRNAKTYRLNPISIKERLINEKWSYKQVLFSNLAIPIYEKYEQKLQSTETIDFEDMINLAVDSLKKHKDLDFNIYDHILIDEYQDISKQRFELIKTLMEKNSNCKLFCVGDDWQSIMGFAGSNPEFFVNFEKYFDHPKITYLTRNYRSIRSIVELGNDIIKNNVDGSQIEKKVESLIDKRNQIKLFSSLHQESYKKQYFQQIADHCKETIDDLLSEDYTSDDIMVLTRIYKNKMFNDYFKEYIKRKRIRYLTVHKSKGLQAKVVIIIDVSRGLYGFPCELQNPRILEPARIVNNFERESEERRLFYVAVSRAKEDVILYSQYCSHSKFIDEIFDHLDVETLPY